VETALAGAAAKSEPGCKCWAKRQRHQSLWQVAMVAALTTMAIAAVAVGLPPDVDSYRMPIQHRWHREPSVFAVLLLQFLVLVAAVPKCLKSTDMGQHAKNLSARGR